MTERPLGVGDYCIPALGSMADAPQTLVVDLVGRHMVTVAYYASDVRGKRKYIEVDLCRDSLRRVRRAAPPSHSRLPEVKWRSGGR